MMSSACVIFFIAITCVHRIIDGASSPLVEITVSPMATESSLRILDISWNVHHRWRLGDWVALYSEPPNIKTQKSLFTGPADSVATTCLSTNPTWMADNWESLKRLKLAQVFLPGSHNSGSYQLAYTPFEPNMFDKYVYTQDEPILEQLIHGARYLDFRIGRYTPVKSILDLLIRPAESEFWLNHDFVQVNRLASALNEVKLFLNNTQEIVVIDIHAFPVGRYANCMTKLAEADDKGGPAVQYRRAAPEWRNHMEKDCHGPKRSAYNRQEQRTAGFKKRSKSHVELIEFLNLHMGDHLASYMGYETTLEEVRKTGKRLILAYNRASIVHMHLSSLWRPISQKWGDVRLVQDLHKYLTKTMTKSHASGMSAVMAELTPTAWDLVTDEQSGLRTMMDNCNHNVTEWFRDDWGLTANFVAVDFIRSTGIVSAAISWNKEKASLSTKIGNKSGNVH